MSFWKILTSPGGVEGCRASVEAAVVTNIKRAKEGTPFERRSVAVSEALSTRYKVVKRAFDPPTVLFEAAPLAFQAESRVPQIVAEYVVDQEFPGQSQVWLSELMPELLNDFANAKGTEVTSALGGMFLVLFSVTLVRPHWEKWLPPETRSKIQDVGGVHARKRWPDMFDD